MDNLSYYMTAIENRSKISRRITNIVSKQIDSYSNLLMEKLAKYGYGIGDAKDKRILGA